MKIILKVNDNHAKEIIPEAIKAMMDSGKAVDKLKPGKFNGMLLKLARPDLFRRWEVYIYKRFGNIHLVLSTILVSVDKK